MDVNVTTLASAVASASAAILSDAPWPPKSAFTWTPRRIEALVPVLDPVRVLPRQRTTTAFWNVARDLESANEEAGEDGFAPDAGKPDFTQGTMRTHEFFKPSPESTHYYTGSIQDAHGETHRDLRPLEPLIEAMQSSGRVAPGNASLKAWFGTAGSVMPLHYDSSHNVFAQLWGVKHFLLFSPDDEAAAHDLYPRVHPLAHYSQASDATTLSRTSGLHVRMKPGDILYLPPFWMHRARCQLGPPPCADATHLSTCSSPQTEECISVNAWFPSKEMAHAGAATKLPLPFEPSWSARQIAESALLFLRLLLSHVGLPATERSLFGFGPAHRPPSPASAMRWLLGTRWRNAQVGLLRKRGAAVTADDELECDAAFLSLGERSKFEVYAAKRGEVLSRIEEGPIRLTLVADQIERVAHLAAGGRAIETYRLLHRLAECLEHEEASAVKDEV